MSCVRHGKNVSRASGSGGITFKHPPTVQLAGAAPAGVQQGERFERHPQLRFCVDALDGRVARLANQTSDFGAQLDSLSDLVTFGAAPAFLMVKM